MFLRKALLLSILVLGCTVAATPSGLPPARIDEFVHSPTSEPLVDAAGRELDRWLAICRRDPMDFLDNREYCLRLGPWADYHP